MDVIEMTSSVLASPEFPMGDLSAFQPAMPLDGK
jgi:hypothetical protein